MPRPSVKKEEHDDASCTMETYAQLYSDYKTLGKQRREILNRPEIAQVSKQLRDIRKEIAAQHLKLFGNA